MAHILLAALLCVLLHLGAIALAGILFDVGLREFRLGFGARLAGWGKFSLGWVPLGGFVKFDMLDDPGPTAPERPLENAPLAVRILIALAGCTTLLAIAYAILGAQAGAALLATPMQLADGAISPLTRAQAMLAGATSYVHTHGLLATMGMVAAKMAAFNLLPYPGSNGGHVLAEIAKALRVSRFWPEQVNIVLLIGLTALMGSWVVAFAFFVSNG